MSLAARFITGVALGIEFNAAPGVYVVIYLGIAEIVFYNEEELEDE
jgi:hypothetical protein